MNNDIKIKALFQPQQWVFDRAVDSEPGILVDVTEKILSLSLEQLHDLSDNRRESDDLVNLDQLGHSGPFYVQVEDEICEFFDVSSLRDITQNMLDEARRSGVTPKMTRSIRFAEGRLR